ncbi:hypothetical protein [Microlunatus sp. GCM10028923]|uniref:hypothetical protein n=1 Tax=Microlunatus sp. GCM10028923 TaxID=3273400 RepID=UPI003613C635
MRDGLEARSFLLAGGPGAGKSTVSEVLRDQGMHAIDLDYGFARHENRAGEQVPFPAEPSWDWLMAHSWNWRIPLIDAAIAEATGPVVLAGTARNMFDLLDRFDVLLLLTMDDATRNARLADPRRNNVFGKVGDTALWSRWWHQLVESELTARGAVIIDASQPIEAVVTEVRNALDTDVPRSW